MQYKIDFKKLKWEVPFIFYISLLISILFLVSNLTAKDEFPILKGPYLGQKPPGTNPEVFAPGIISTDISEGCSGWGIEMEYFIFQRWIDGKPKLYIMNQKQGKWSEPVLLPFGDNYRVGDFTIAPDGKTMVFASKIFIEEFGLGGEGAVHRLKILVRIDKLDHKNLTRKLAPKNLMSQNLRLIFLKK